MPDRKIADQTNVPLKRTVLLASDSSNSVIAEITDGAINTIGYSAYGEQSAQQAVATRLGFNGQLRETTIGWYLLGNGYRAYNPRLMRFHSPDSWSPFGEGGLNPYMYCVGDPVNRVDPTGHWGALAALSGIQRLGMAGYVMSTVGAGLNISSLWINRGSATLLGAISGLSGMVAGVASMFNLPPQVSQALTATSLISGTASTFLGYRAMRANFRHLGWHEAPFSRPSNSPPAYFDVYPQSGATRIKPPSPPPYPLNRATLIPTSAGEKAPMYSRQDPTLFTTPLIDANNAQIRSPTPTPIGVFGTSPPRYLPQRRQELLNRMDGLPASTTIRQRK